MPSIVLVDGPAAGNVYPEDGTPIAAMNVAYPDDDTKGAWYVPDQYDPLADQWLFRYDPMKDVTV